MFLKRLGIALTVLVLSACQLQQSREVNGIGVTPPPPKKIVGPVTVEGNCDQRGQDGYKDKIKISVKDNVVSSLDWTATPRGGSCRFLSKNFTQVSSSPNGDLQSKKDKACHVYVWQDEHHVTVAVYGCKKSCKQNDKILPVLLEPTTGACKAAGGDNAVTRTPT